MTPLQSDVGDVTEACEDLGQLLLLKPRTTVGRFLRDAVYDARDKLLGRCMESERQVGILRAEVEGLRAQNAKLTEAVLGLERVNLLLRGRERHDEMIEAIRRI